MSHTIRATDGNGRPGCELTCLYRERPRREPMLPVPDGMVVGRPFRTLSVGTVRSRWDGTPRGRTITAEHLSEMARLVVERAPSDPTVIDWAHASSHTTPDATDPARAASLGLVVGAYVEDEGDGRGLGLYVIPAYTPRGASVVEDQRGALWSSPEFTVGDVYARHGDDPERVGGAQLLAVALTNRPAQVASAIDAVMMTEAAAPAGGTEDDMDDDRGADPGGEAESKDAIIARLKARIAELEAAEAKTEGAEAKVEALTERTATLAAEVQTLREQAHTAREQARVAERERAIDALFAEGRIDGGDETRASCRDAYDVRDTHPRWWAVYSEAAPGRFGAAGRVSHPGGGVETTPEDRGVKLAEQVRRIATDRKLGWEDALRVARRENPEAWEGV